MKCLEQSKAIFSLLFYIGINHHKEPSCSSSNKQANTLREGRGKSTEEHLTWPDRYKEWDLERKQMLSIRASLPQHSLLWHAAWFRSNTTRFVQLKPTFLVRHSSISSLGSNLFQGLFIGTTGHSSGCRQNAPQASPSRPLLPFSPLLKPD